ncbi:hypothetical protein CF394_00735 [Tetzosporium hominis]|uniref:Uncharacterized protein n=1 Tax=Tetzosporium hominis TaxID=2020506 RepID=A0A264W797_9BACL|nr:hypothetical protein [Tetzosporium hominis]OZS79463.1 hypothetical protein CF394_00735 [Tetzosporium hominis]
MNDPKVFENPCAICRKREATQLCDFVTEYFWVSHKGQVTGTCDLPICRDCAHESGGHDFCPEHKKMLPTLKLQDPVMQKRIIQYHMKVLKEYESPDN